MTMGLLGVLLFSFLIVGIYLIVSDRLNLPRFSTLRNMRSIKNDVEKSSALSDFYNVILLHVSRFVRVSNMKEGRLKKALHISGSTQTPREYIADIYIKVLICVIVSLIIGMKSLVIGVIVLGLGIFYVYSNKRKLFAVSDKNRQLIEKELPHFISYIMVNLEQTKNVALIFQTYNDNYNTPLTKELAVTIADIRTGNMETALSRFEQRVGSPILSEVISAIISSVRGNNMTVTFQRIEDKVENTWNERLVEEAIKNKAKIERKSWGVFACAIVCVIIILGTTLMSAVGSLM